MQAELVRNTLGWGQRMLEWMVDIPHALTAVGFIRSIYGLTTLALLLSSWSDRYLFFGPTGLLSSPDIHEQWVGGSSWSVLDLAQTTATFNTMYVAIAVVAALTMLGIGGKPVLILQYVGTWSLFSQNALLGDGGDNIMYICGLFLLLTHCFERFTVLGRKRRLPRIPIPGWISILAHNTGVLLIAVQICIVYFIAGSFKMQGDMWTSGTALYYVLRNPEYHLPGLDLLFYFAAPSVIATYVTVLSQVLFPILIIFKQTRLAAVLLMMGFHLGIAVIMGLTSFGLIMFACDTIFVSRHLGRLIDRLTGKTAAGRKREQTPVEDISSLDAHETAGPAIETSGTARPAPSKPLTHVSIVHESGLEEPA